MSKLSALKSRGLIAAEESSELCRLSRVTLAFETRADVPLTSPGLLLSSANAWSCEWYLLLYAVFQQKLSVPLDHKSG